jgi:N,N'-diacetyllegionaminate synthase
MTKTFIIAEIGVNHNGSLNIAKKMIDAAKKAGADAVKFQIFLADDLVLKNTKKVDYQKLNDQNKTMYRMLKKVQLSFNEFKILKKYCDKKKIVFISSAFDEKSILFLKSLNPKFFKVPSGEINNLPNLKIISKFNKKTLISTGMSTMNEIKDIIKIVKNYGLKKKNLIIMHCNSSYPTSINDANLNIIKTLKNKFNVKVGYSDHTRGILAPIIAVSFGAEFIEKHFTLKQSLKGPDHFFSLTPNNFKIMVKNIRETEKLFGNLKKNISKSELQNRYLSRKSIVAKKIISKGEKFSLINLTTKRPGDGISAINWDKILGKVSKKNYKIDDQI